MNSSFEHSMKNATKTVDEARETAGKTAHRARSAVLEGLHAAANALTALRGLGLVDALGWVGLQRRRRSAPALVTFGAGFLAGAVAGVLLAPVSGAEMRRSIVERATNIGRKAEDAGAREVERTGEKASETVKRHKAPNGQPEEPPKHA
jgi:YtxH-like protein